MSIRISKLVGAIALWGLLAAPIATAQNLILNGSFESGVDPGEAASVLPGSTDIDSWTLPAAGGVNYVGTLWLAAEGARSVWLPTEFGTIAQSFATEVGRAYSVDFAFAILPGAPNANAVVEVAAAGGAQSFGIERPDGAANPEWVERRFVFTATSNPTTLSFHLASGSPDQAMIDDVRVTERQSTVYEYDPLDRLTAVVYPNGDRIDYTYDAAGNILSRDATVFVPEPGSAAMLLAGIGLLATLDRRRRRGLAPGALFVLLAVIALPAANADAQGRANRGADWQERVRARVADEEYEVRWSRVRLRKVAEAWQAPNRAQGFRTHFLERGVRVKPRVASENGGNDWELGLTLLAYGRGDHANAVRTGTPRPQRKRVRYARGEVAEWFVNEPGGLKQGFTLAAPPEARPGAHPPLLGTRAARANEVYVSLRVDGGLRPVLAADRQSIDFVRGGGAVAVAHYDQLVVTDANGVELDAWMEVFRDAAGNGVRLVFDDTDAAWPIEIDPLLTTPAWSVTGNQPTAGLGFAVTGAGDVNGDGLGDVLVGVPFFDGGFDESGRAYLYMGAPGGLSQTPDWFAVGQQVAGTRAPIGDNARFGFAMAGGGDVDGDGFDDFLVSSAPSSQNPGPNSPLPGRVFLYRGSPAGPSDVADWMMTGRDFRRLGLSLAMAGSEDLHPADGILDDDLNGDGYADVVIGEPGSSGTSDQGRVYVFYGQPDGLLGGGDDCSAQASLSPGVVCIGGTLAAPQPTVWGEAGSSQEFGQVVAAAGDLNCDGVGDLAIGQPRYDDSNGIDQGRVLIHLGSASGVVSAAPEIALRGANVGPYPRVELGRSLVAIREIPGFTSGGGSSDDICGNVLVGAPGYEGFDGEARAGGVFRIIGTATSIFILGNDPLLVGSAPLEAVGVSLANVGDVNGDGNEEILVGAPGEPGQPTSAGNATLLVVSGRQLAFSNENIVRADVAWRAFGEAEGEHFGAAVGGPGDVNGDGLADLLVAAPTGRLGLDTVNVVSPSGPGQAFVFYGALEPSLVGLLGLDPSLVLAGDSYAWSGRTFERADATTDNDVAPGVGAGPNPDSLVISTGLASDAGRGDSFFSRNAAQSASRDDSEASLILQVPPGSKTLRFSTQYVTANPSPDPLPKVTINYEYGETDVSDVCGRPGEDDDEPPPEACPLTLDTPIEETGRGVTRNPISHAIDVDGQSTVGLELRIQELLADTPDAAVILSKVFFSDVPLPDYLSPDPSAPDYAAQCAALGSQGADGTDADQNDDCIVDNVVNPLPTDLSRSAGTYRFRKSLVRVPGRLIPFEFYVRYASDRTNVDQLGPKWSHNWDSFLEESEDFSGNGCPDTMYVWTGAGNVEVFDEIDEDDPNPSCPYQPAYPGIQSSINYNSPCCDNGIRYDSPANNFSRFSRIAPGSKRYRRDFEAHAIGVANFITYDAATGQVDYVTDSRGEQWLFSYDTSLTPPRLVAVDGPGAQISFEYDGLGFLSSIVDANGLATTFSYDADGNVLTVTDADGVQVVGNEYESASGLGVEQTGDRVVRQLNATPGDLGRTTIFTGDAVESRDRADGHSRETYDVFGRVVERRVLLDGSPGNNLFSCAPQASPCFAVWSYVYNEQNLVVEEVDPRGVVTRSEYNDKGRLTCRIGDADGTPQVTGFIYDIPPAGRPGQKLVAKLVQKDSAQQPLCPPQDAVPYDDPLSSLQSQQPGELPKWLVTTFANNDAPLRYGLLVGVVDPLGRETTFDRYPRSAPGSQEPDRGQLRAVTNAVGATRQFTLDSLGHMKTETDPLGEVTHYTHDLLGRRTSRTDPRGHTWRWSYDAGGRVSARFDPLFNFESYSYDGRDRLVSRTDRTGAVWTRTHTPAGWVETDSDPLGNTTTYAYDEEGRQTRETDARGFETLRSYDAAGRLASLTDAKGHASTFEYDAAGNLEAVVNALGHRTEFDTDNRGRRSAVRDALDLVRGTETVIGYDARGNALTLSRPHVLGQAVTTQTWSETEQLLSTSDPAGVTTTFSYDDVDQVDLRTQVERDLVTDHDWDLAGQLTNVSVSTTATGVLATASAAYDAAGNAESVTDPNGNPTRFSYDPLDRVSQEQDAEQFAAGDAVTYGYEPRNGLERRTNARDVPATSPSELSWDYDPAGRRIETRGFEPGYDWTILETLDEEGNSIASTASSSDPTRAPATVLRSFDELGLQTVRSVELAAGLQPTVTAEYDELGNLSALVYSDDVTRVDYAYDEVNRIISATYTGAGPIQQTTYEYDAAGNLSRTVRPDGSETTAEYDLANRPLRIRDRKDGETIFDAQFVLDAAGRRVDADIVLPLDPAIGDDETFGYDTANRLVTRDGSEVLGYDADGNLESGRIGGATRALTYDARNRLVGVDGDVYRYDADGNRVARTSGGTTTYYLYDPLGRLLEELDGSGNVIARYVHGVGLISREAGATTAVYHYDSRGSTVALTDLGGTLTDRYAYTPYGVVQHDPSNTTPNPFTYDGRDGVFEEGNGLYGMKSRHYAPELMRFVQKDPAYSGRIDRPQSLNRYAFVEGNPIERIDPTGESGFSTVNSEPRDRQSPLAATEPTDAPPETPCTNPETENCGPTQITAQSKQAIDFGKDQAGDQVAIEGATAGVVDSGCDAIGGSVCSTIRDWEEKAFGFIASSAGQVLASLEGPGRAILDAAEPVADFLDPAGQFVSQEVLDPIYQELTSFCDDLPDGICAEVASGLVEGLKDVGEFLVVDPVEELFDVGLTGIAASTGDVIYGAAVAAGKALGGLVDGAEDLGGKFIDFITSPF